jgi:Pyruvate kinase, barrel domain
MDHLRIDKHDSRPRRVRVDLRAEHTRRRTRTLRPGTRAGRVPSMAARHCRSWRICAVRSSAARCRAATGCPQLARLGGRQPAVVLKIETQRGFENLPDMLLAAMRAPCCGVMIARGNLAVECGFERLAEVQEEILWICEAAHVPMIWATQVLETLSKD